MGTPHRQVDTVTTGSLVDGEFRVTVDGIPIQTNDGDTEIQVLSTDFAIVVEGPVFRGILIRMENTDVAEVVPGTDLSEAQICNGLVGSATHIDNAPKTQAMAQVILASSATTPPRPILLDITVVVQLRDRHSIFYYQNWTILAGTNTATNGDEEIDSEAPVDEIVIPTDDYVSVVDILEQEPDLSLFHSLLRPLPLYSTLSSPTRRYTVFAPIIDTLQSIDPKFLTPAWEMHLIHLLQFHIVTSASEALIFHDSSATNGTASSTTWTTLTVGTNISTLTGERVQVIASTVGEERETDSNGAATIQGLGFTASQVLRPDLIVDNGVVHVVDQFFIPFSFAQSLWDVLIRFNDGDSSNNNPTMATAVGIFTSLLVQAEMDSILRSRDWTVLLPTLDAWENIALNMIPTVPEDLELVPSILARHIIVGVYPESFLVDGTVLTTINNHTMLVEANLNSTPNVMIDGVTIDNDQDEILLAGNGVIYWIHQVLGGDLLPTVPPSSPTPTEENTTTEPTTPTPSLQVMTEPTLVPGEPTVEIPGPPTTILAPTVEPIPVTDRPISSSAGGSIDVPKTVLSIQKMLFFHGAVGLIVFFYSTVLI